ncbi:MAG: hypothetical protein JXA71_18975 [Chitinispirillaceae bacterium]|nr:hypothetical protein [Chitinispirillaceae bacterium]
MDSFIQYLPYDALAKRTITLEQDKLTLTHKSLNRNFSDEFPYAKINPGIKTVRRGEHEWSNIIYIVVVTYIVFFILTKMTQALYARTVFVVFQVAMLAIAAVLGALMFIKKDYYYLFDNDGECILMIKANKKGREFVKKLKEKLASV